MRQSNQILIFQAVREMMKSVDRENIAIAMSDLPEIFQSDNPDLLRRMERIRENFERLNLELSELEAIVLDENYIQGLVNSQTDAIRKPR